MEIKNFFFDSYAIIEIVKGNPKYIKYIDTEIILTEFNLPEITSSILNDFGEEKAREAYQKFSECTVQISEEVLIEALKFRKENKKRELSYTDCIGYIYAKKHKLLFLTGDEQFKDKENVEFVKK
ncbi:MAG: type II toxin-antitoxin system VapC family toxin [bacterium]|nr:type II toxin-antitoxin system VapC family toxin [bacterium]